MCVVHYPPWLGSIRLALLAQRLLLRDVCDVHHSPPPRLVMRFEHFVGQPERWRSLR